MKISCWNIHGLGKSSVFQNKFQNIDFLNKIKTNDIIILSEIWGHEISDLPGFDIITINHPKKQKAKKSGRFSGGILIAVKPFLKQGITFIKKSANFIWCKLDKDFFNLSKDTFMCACYIPPNDSPYYDADHFSILRKRC